MLANGGPWAGQYPALMGALPPFYFHYRARHHQIPALTSSSGPSPGQHPPLPISRGFQPGSHTPGVTGLVQRAGARRGRDSGPPSVEVDPVAASCPGGSPALGGGVLGPTGGTHGAAPNTGGDPSPMWSAMMPSFAGSNMAQFGHPQPPLSTDRYLGHHGHSLTGVEYPLGSPRGMADNTVPPSASTAHSYSGTADDTPASAEVGFATAPSSYDLVSPASANSRNHSALGGAWSAAAVPASAAGAPMERSSSSASGAAHVVRVPAPGAWSKWPPDCNMYYTQGAATSARHGIPGSMMVTYPPGGNPPPPGARVPRAAAPRLNPIPHNPQATGGLEALSDAASRVSPSPGPLPGGADEDR